MSEREKEIHIDQKAVGDKLVVQPDGKVLVNEEELTKALEEMKPIAGQAHPEGIRITINIS